MAYKSRYKRFRTYRTHVSSDVPGRRDIDFVAVNDLTDTKTLAHLLKYDSIMGNLEHNITAGGDTIKVDGDSFQGLF